MKYFNSHTPLQHLRKPAVQTGGLCWIVFARWEDVKQWPAVNPLTGICDTGIQLKPGKIWYECQVVDKGRIFNENMRVGPAGPYWEMSVAGYFGGNNANLTLAAAPLPFHRYVVMFKDRDGLIRFLGREDAGADIAQIDYSSGDREASRKRNIQFNWEHCLPAPIYQGSLTSIFDEPVRPPFAMDGEFNSDYVNDFNIGG